MVHMLIVIDMSVRNEREDLDRGQQQAKSVDDWMEDLVIKEKGGLHILMLITYAHARTNAKAHVAIDACADDYASC